VRPTCPVRGPDPTKSLGHSSKEVLGRVRRRTSLHSPELGLRLLTQNELSILEMTTMKSTKHPAALVLFPLLEEVSRYPTVRSLVL